MSLFIYNKVYYIFKDVFESTLVWGVWFLETTLGFRKLWVFSAFWVSGALILCDFTAPSGFCCKVWDYSVGFIKGFHEVTQAFKGAFGSDASSCTDAWPRNPQPRSYSTGPQPVRPVKLECTEHRLQHWWVLQGLQVWSWRASAEYATATHTHSIYIYVHIDIYIHICIYIYMYLSFALTPATLSLSFCLCRAEKREARVRARGSWILRVFACPTVQSLWGF